LPSLNAALAPVWPHLVCPVCRDGLQTQTAGLACLVCAQLYPVADGIADLRPAASREKPELAAWTEHWSPEKQQTVVQRFFSFYRKAVFAPAIAHYVNRYLAPSGLLLEAGSGTSETSIYIDKRNGARVLVAAEIVLPVLRACHPVMDVRLGADVFRIPLASASVDGIWNVGVMEHFEHDQIDQVMRECGRVLKPGGRIVLFWPGRDSVPQRILRLGEAVINRWQPERRFRFHPDEISQLRSLAQGRDVLQRNDFDVVRVDYGVRTLLGFKILVGEKPPAGHARRHS
jgi:SAM-dependent methyltransferase